MGAKPGKLIPASLPVVLGLLVVLAPTALRGQERPPPPDTAAGDSAAVADSAAVQDTASPDTAAAEGGPVSAFPRHPEPVAAGFSTGVWEWDREALALSSAFTVGQLLDGIPGIVHLRGGYVGMPEAATAFGLGPGRIRVFLDGFELDPLDNPVLELSRIQLGGIERVRVERRGGGLRVELRSVSPFDRRPWSLIEAGTGDLNTNLFRGSFAKASEGGGRLSLGIDRIDTDGAGGAQPGVLFGGWLKYALLEGEDGGIELELRGRRADRDTLFDPTEVTRTDWVLRARGRLAEGVVAGVYVGGSGTGVGEDDGALVGEEGDEGPGETEALPAGGFSGRQAGARITAAGEHVWTRGALRLRDRTGRPDVAAEAAAGVRLPGLASLDVDGSWEDWGAEAVTATRARAVLGPVLGVRAFAEREWGERGIYDVPAARRTVAFRPRFEERTATRLGASLDLGRLALGGAVLELEADSLRPLRFGPDDGGVVQHVEGPIEGYEAFASVPLLFRGLSFDASGQYWEEGRGWRYLPRRSWELGVTYNRTFLESGNLELLVRATGRGRSEMAVPIPAAPGTDGGEDDAGGGDGETGTDGGSGSALLLPGSGLPVGPSGSLAGADATGASRQEGSLRRVPPYESWSLYFQIRIASLRIFVKWGNLTNRPEQRDFPDLLLPGQHAAYGVKWVMWN